MGRLGTIELVLPRDPEKLHVLQHLRLVRRAKQLAHHLPILCTHKNRLKRLKEDTCQQLFFPEESSEGEGESRKKKRKEDKNTHITPLTIRIKFSASAAGGAAGLTRGRPARLVRP